jgi:hypothetical protein
MTREEHWKARDRKRHKAHYFKVHNRRFAEIIWDGREKRRKESERKYDQ